MQNSNRQNLKPPPKVRNAKPTANENGAKIFFWKNKFYFLGAVIFLAAVILIFAFSCSGSSAQTSGNTASYGYILEIGDNLFFSQILDKDSENFTLLTKYSKKVGKTEHILAAEANHYHYSLNAYLHHSAGRIFFQNNFYHDSKTDFGNMRFRVGGIEAGSKNKADYRPV